MTTTGELAREYLLKFPSTSKLALARKLFNDYPLVFNSVEHARTIIRLHTGACGVEKRRKVKDVIERIKLPESDSVDWSPYFIPASVTKLLVLADIHLPYHDVDALNLALEYGKKEGINGILINGDLLDFYKASRFEQDPRMRGLKGEMDIARQFFAYLRQEFDCPIYYKLGNHDERWEKYLKLKAPELLDMEEFRLDIILKLGEFRVEYITDKRIVKHGHLDILHGHEFFGAPSQAVNPARGVFMKTLDSCVIGHLHKSSSHTDTSLGGNMITTHSIGCLCDLHPEYARINKWNLGFGINELHGKNYIFHNKRIFEGKVF